MILFHIAICFVFPCLLWSLYWRLEEGAASCSNSRSAADSARSRRTQDCCVAKCYSECERLGGNVKRWTCGFWYIFVRTKSAVALHGRESCVGIEESAMKR